MGAITTSGMAIDTSRPSEPDVLKLAVLVSGGGTNLQAIIDQIADGRLQQVRIIGVIASRPGTFAEERARRAGIPVAVVGRAACAGPEAYDEAMLSALTAFPEGPPGLIVLAGFLSLLGPQLVRQYSGRIINVHPALVPCFCGPGMYGIKPHEAALARGVKVTGATIHFVDENYDEGPIILQKAVDVLPDDTPQTLQQRVMKQAEQVILPEAIRLFAAHRIVIDGRIVRIREEIA